MNNLVRNILNLPTGQLPNSDRSDYMLRGKYLNAEALRSSEGYVFLKPCSSTFLSAQKKRKKKKQTKKDQNENPKIPLPFFLTFSSLSQIPLQHPPQ
jgi:hypothetical protein